MSKKKRTKHDPNRVIVKKTMDWYEDQIEALEAEAEKQGIGVQALLRQDVDQKYNLPK